MGIIPPGVAKSWDKCNSMAQADLIGYNHIREYEENQTMIMMAKAGVSRGI